MRLLMIIFDELIESQIHLIRKYRPMQTPTKMRNQKVVIQNVSYKLHDSYS